MVHAASIQHSRNIKTVLSVTQPGCSVSCGNESESRVRKGAEGQVDVAIFVLDSALSPFLVAFNIYAMELDFLFNSNLPLGMLARDRRFCPM